MPCIFGFALNLVTGAIFFAGNPYQHQNWVFGHKLLFIVLAGVNVIVYYASGLDKQIGGLVLEPMYARRKARRRRIARSVDWRDLLGPHDAVSRQRLLTVSLLNPRARACAFLIVLAVGAAHCSSVRRHPLPCPPASFGAT
jgi:hypothetical protein